MRNPSKVKILRKIYDSHLKSIWDDWLGYGYAGSPFNEENDLESLVSHEFAYDVGYVAGISGAMGWSVAMPLTGRKEWRPE